MKNRPFDTVFRDSDDGGHKRATERPKLKAFKHFKKQKLTKTTSGFQNDANRQTKTKQ